MPLVIQAIRENIAQGAHSYHLQMRGEIKQTVGHTSFGTYGQYHVSVYDASSKIYSCYELSVTDQDVKVVVPKEIEVHVSSHGLVTNDHQHLFKPMLRIVREVAPQHFTIIYQQLVQDSVVELEFSYADNYEHISNSNSKASSISSLPLLEERNVDPELPQNKETDV